MVVNLNVQYNGGFLLDILLLTQGPIVVWFDGIVIVYYCYLFNHVVCVFFFLIMYYCSVVLPFVFAAFGGLVWRLI